MTDVDRTPTDYWENGGGTLGLYGSVTPSKVGQEATLKQCYEIVKNGTPGVVQDANINKLSNRWKYGIS